MTQTSTVQIKATPQIVQAKKPTTVGVQRVFKYCSIFCVLMVILCLPGFLRFREYCQAKGYYVFSTEGIYMILIGFISIFITRYGYYKFARQYMDQFVKPKYQGQQRQRKIDTFLKLSYDWAFYLTMSIYFYSQFKNQYWFPKAVGGQGSCSDIYKEYPNWPVPKRSSIQDYFCYQLGVHLFSLFQLFVIRGNKERKYFQWTLHHTLASALILFSMWCNETVMGAMILAVHDVSDIFLTVSRLYFQAKLPKYLKNLVIQIIMIVQIYSSWIYFRLVVFPCCLLYNVFQNIPQPINQWYMIKYQYIYLLFMASLLVIMHVYWLCYLIKATKAYISKQEVVNVYDVHKNQ